MLDVLLVYRMLGPGSGGLGIDVRDLANGLVARGHRATVATVGSVRDGFDERVRIVDCRGAGVAAEARRHDIVHAYSLLPASFHFAAIASARASGRRLVWTPMLHPARRGHWDGSPLRRAMRLWDAAAPRSVRLADAVFAATSAELDLFRDIGVRRVELVPPAVHPVPLADDQAVGALRARYGVGDAPLVVSAAQRLEPRKGIPFALDTLRELRERVPAAHLLLLGLADGPRADGVVYAGRVPDEELWAGLRAADAVFVPSRYEAFSRVVVEAWQQQRPVVVTDGVGLAADVAGTGGIVTRFGAAAEAAAGLERLIRTPDLARRYGEAGYRLVQERYLVDDVVDRAVAAYASLEAA